MALIVPLRSELSVHKLAERGFRELRGVGNFAAAAVSATLAVPGFTLVDSVQLTPVNPTPVAGDVMSCGSVILANGTYTIAADGTIIVARAAGTTAGLQFSFTVKGR